MLLLKVATPIPLLSKEGRRGSAGVVNKVAKLPLRCREASAFQFGALREYLRGGYASRQTTPSAARTPLLEKEGNFAQINVELRSGCRLVALISVVCLPREISERTSSGNLATRHLPDSVYDGVRFRSAR